MKDHQSPQQKERKRKQSIVIDGKTNIVIHQVDNPDVSKTDIHQSSNLLSVQQNQNSKNQRSSIFVALNQKLMSQMSIGAKEDLNRDLLQNFMKVTDSNGVLLQQKYNIEYIRQVLQRDLISFESAFNKFVIEYGQSSKGVNLVDFIYILMPLVDTPSHETIYLASAIIDFFEAVTQVEKTDSRKFHIDEKTIKQTKNYIKIPDVTLFLCENHPYNEQTLPAGIKIPTKALPLPKIFDNSTNERTLREIDLNAPIIFRDSNESLQRLNKDKIHIDSVHHNNNLIMKSLYADEIKKLIVLDQYSDIFIAYDKDCSMQYKFRPSSQHLRGQVCIDFFWSEKQLRIGSVFRDNFLAFWDANDNFQFEKSFNVGESILEEQTKIWYIATIDTWITSDNHKSLNFWNLEKEEVVHQIRSDLFSKGIINVLEIQYLKVVAVGSSDNIVSVWDFIGQKLLFSINVNHNHLNLMSYFSTYQVILTGGYDNHICIYEFHPTYNDANKMGELQGHMSIITAFKGIEGTPMIVSSDDKYNVKIWDIRSTNCIQSLDIDLRNPIKQIHATMDRVIFQSSRVTSFEFDIDVQQKVEIQKKAKAQHSLQGLAEGYQPIGSYLNLKKQDLIVCTSKDVRFFDINNGKIKKIISSLSENKEDQITSFQMIDSCQKILIATSKGILRIHELKSGELLSEIPAHTNEITGLKMDHLNKLLITTSSDSSILIQKINPKLDAQKYREILNSHYGHEITLIEVSVYHNIFVTASYDNTLLIWSYEFGRLMASFELEQDQEPTAISIINGYSILIVATTKGYIYFIKFTQVEDNLDLEIIANINMIKSLILRGEALKKLVTKEIKRAFQLQEKESRKLKLEKKKLQVEENKIKQKSKIFKNPENQPVNLNQISLNDIISPQNVAVQQSQIFQDAKFFPSNGKTSPAVDKQNMKKLLKKADEIKTNLNKNIETISKKKIDITSLYNENEVKIAGDDTELFDLGLEKKIEKQNNSNDNDMKKESNIYANKLIFDLSLDQDQKIDFDTINNNKNVPILPESCTLIVGVNNGEIRKYDISSLFQRINIKLVPHCKNKMNYNAFRQNFENYTNSLSNHKIQCFKQNKNNIMKDIIVLNNMNRSKVITKFQTSVLKLSQVRGLIVSSDDGERAFDPYFNQSKNMVDLIQGHKSQLTSLEFLKVHNNQNEMIISCGQDNYIKIWNFFGKISLLAAVNIMHPLPIKWDFKVDFDLIYRNKILLAIKSLDAVAEKFKTKMNFQMYQKFNIRNLVNYIEQREIKIKEEELEKSEIEIQNKTSKAKKQQSPEKKNIKENQESEQQKRRASSSPQIKEIKKGQQHDDAQIIKLMKDEYTPRDLLFDKIKHLYKNELTGPSLKQLQEMKRIENMKNQEQQTLQPKLRRLDEYQHYLNQEEKNKETKFYAAFFHPEYRKRMLEHFNEAYYLEKPAEIRILEKKLDNLLMQKQISDAHTHSQQIHQSLPISKASIPNSMVQIQSSTSRNQHSRQSSSHQAQDLQLSKQSSVSPNGKRFSQLNEAQGIFVTAPPSMTQTNFNNVSDQIISSQKITKQKNQLSPIKIVTQGEGQNQKSMNRVSIMNLQSQQVSGVDILQDPVQKSYNKFDPHTNQQQIEYSTGSTNNFLKPRYSQQDMLGGSSQLYFTSKKLQKNGVSQQQLQNQSNNNSIVQSKSQDKIVKQLNFALNDKSYSQNENDFSRIHHNQLHSERNTSRYANNNSVQEDFHMKKEAKEIFNFNKKIPQSTTDKFSTGGEYLIKINQLERNHGLKFKLFENTNKYYSQTARNSVSPTQMSTEKDKKFTQNSYKQSIQNQVGTNVLIDPFISNSSKEFLEYAQEKSLLSQQLQENYVKQTQSISKQQVKNFFLSSIEKEEDRKNFLDKFESTIVQPQCYTQLLQTQSIQTQQQGITSDQTLSNQKINLNNSKIQIPPLNLSQTLKNNNPNSISQMSSGKKQNYLSLTQRGSGNNNGNIPEADSTQDSSIIPISSKQQYFSKTSRKCFQDVVKNMNTKLNKSRINHHKGVDVTGSNQKGFGGMENESTHFQETLHNYQTDESNQIVQNSNPFLSHRNFKSSKEDLLKNSLNYQLKPNYNNTKQQISYK